MSVGTDLIVKATYWPHFLLNAYEDTTLVKVSLKLLDNPCLKFVDTQQQMYSQQAIELFPNPLIRLGTNIVLICFYPQTLATVGINKTFPYCSRSTHVVQC